MPYIAFTTAQSPALPFARPGTFRHRKTQQVRRRIPSHRPPVAVLYRGTGSLPGVLILPGLGNSDGDYAPLAQSLLEAGHAAVSVARVARYDWARNARGLLLGAYWRGTLSPDDVLGWYFARVDAALEDLQGLRTSILGHSAGGWLARAYLAALEERSEQAARSEFAALVTLGTPHAPPPAGSFDQTRGLLTYIAQECKLGTSVERAICVAGRGIVGKQLGKGSVAENVAFYSYRALCGEGGVDGDGVIPLEAAFFEGAEEVIVPECGHSMVGGGEWYGSPKAMQQWQKFLV